MESSPAKSPNSLKSEHLIEGVRPIMVCVGSYKDYGSYRRHSIKEAFSELLDNVHNVNYSDGAPVLRVKNFLNSKQYAYVISTIDNFNKFSEGFVDCTGLIVSGVDKITGENISFLTHQAPIMFLGKHRESFVSNLNKTLVEMQSRCKPDTIDAVLVGGKYPQRVQKYSKTGDWRVPYFRGNYLESIELISGEVKKVLGFEPVVVNGPKVTEGGDDVYYDNQEKRAYLIRAHLNPTSADFTQSDIQEEKEKWDSGKRSN